MSGYNFKKIQIVPPASEFIDVVLSRTQRKTPTVVHKGYAIGRIRNFYIRKVKYTSQTWHEKLDQIVGDFPKLVDIHPFYADLMNVLYDKDHYKLALGQLNMALHLIDGIGKDYVRLLKFGESLYQCKQLKKAALGRMVTVMRRQNQSLAYLEQVRQHLARLPSIDPNTRTLILCGYPSVGKSSMMNKLTRAEVEVQPYAFTTKSLFVGHTDYEHLRWQIIDTPGILDHPLEQRNTIEMQSITALAHLRSAIIYMMDLSGECGYSVQDQVSLFMNIKPLFQNKPLVVALNKSDKRKLSDLDDADRELILNLEKDENCTIMAMSTMTEEGVMEVKKKTCDLLLKQIKGRVLGSKLRKSNVDDIVSRLNVAQPKKRDTQTRTAFIPKNVQDMRDRAAAKMEEEADAEAASPRRLERDVQEEMGADYQSDWKKAYLLANPDWNHDIIPEVLDGKNIADFIDPDVEEKLEELEREEERLIEEGFYNSDNEEDEDDVIIKAAHKEIKKKKDVIIHESRAKRNRNTPMLPRKAIKKTPEELRKHMKAKGVDVDGEELRGRLPRAASVARATSKARATSSVRSKSMARDSPAASGKKRKREEDDDGDMDRPTKAVSRARSTVRDRTVDGVRTKADAEASENLSRVAQRSRNAEGRASESDRRHYTKRPQHLFSGKRTKGTNDRR